MHRNTTTEQHNNTADGWKFFVLSVMNMACESYHLTMQMYHSHSRVFGMRELRKILIQINICTACISYAITIHEYVMTDDDKYFNKYIHTLHSTPLWRILPALDARFLRHINAQIHNSHICARLTVAVRCAGL